MVSLYPLIEQEVSQNMWLAYEHSSKNVAVLKSNKRIPIGCEPVILISFCGSVTPFAYGCTALLRYNFVIPPLG